MTIQVPLITIITLVLILNVIITNVLNWLIRLWWNGKSTQILSLILTFLMLIQIIVSVILIQSCIQ